jgi:hypothetical protein
MEDGSVTGKQIDRLLDILERFAEVAERWADREYPQINETTEATISRVGDHRPPQSVEQYNAFEPEEDRLQKFEKRLKHQA